MKNCFEVRGSIILVLAIAALVLAGCQMSNPFSSSDVTPAPVATGRSSSVIAEALTATPTRTDIARRLSDTAIKCWIGKDPLFAGYSAAGPVQTTGSGWQLTLQPNASASRQPEYIISIVQPGSSPNGYRILVDRWSASRLPAARIDQDLRMIAQGARIC